MTLILASLFGIAVIYTIACLFEEKISPLHGGMACLFSTITFVAFLLYGDNPSAMDVYQGKTTLEITYKDGVPIDSVVVFKEK